MRKIISCLALLLMGDPAQSFVEVPADKKHLACMLWKYSGNDNFVEGSQKFIGLHIVMNRPHRKNSIEVTGIDDPSGIWFNGGDYFALSDADGRNFSVFYKSFDEYKYSFVLKFVGKNITKYTEDWSGGAIRFDKDMKLDKGYGYTGNCALVSSNDGYEYIKQMFISKELEK